MPGKAIALTITAEDYASSILHGIGNALQQIGQVALGVGLARLFEEALSHARELGATVYDVTSQLIGSEAAIRALTAAQAQLNSQQWDSVVVGYAQVGLTEKEQKELASLTEKIDRHRSKLALENAQIQEQTQRVWEMTNRWTEQGLATETARARLADMTVARDQLAKTLAEEEARIAELSQRQATLVPITERVFKGQMSWNEAVEASREQAEDLLRRMRRLAVERGIPYDVTASIHQFAMAVGMSQDQMKTLLPGLIDFMRVIGTAPDRMKDAAKALADIGARGKLTGEEVRQLGNASVPVFAILSKMTGKSREELVELMMKGAIPAAQVFDALSSFFSGFSSAAEEVSQKLPGAVAGFREAIKLNLAYYFRDVGNEIGFLLDKLRDWLGSEETFQRVTEAGAALAAKFREIRDAGQELFNFVKNDLIPVYQEGGLPAAIAVTLDKFGASDQVIRESLIVLGLLRVTLGNIRSDFESVAQAINDLIKPTKDANQALGAELPKQSFLGWLIDQWPIIDVALRGLLMLLAGRLMISAVMWLGRLAFALMGGLPGLIAFLGLWAVSGYIIQSGGFEPALERIIESLERFQARLAARSSDTGRILQAWAAVVRAAVEEVMTNMELAVKVITLGPAALPGELVKSAIAHQKLLDAIANATGIYSEFMTKYPLHYSTAAMKNTGEVAEATAQKLEDLEIAGVGLTPKLSWADVWKAQIAEITAEVDRLLDRLGVLETRAGAAPVFEVTPGLEGAPMMTPVLPPMSMQSAPNRTPEVQSQSVSINVHVGSASDPSLVRRASYQGVYAALREMAGALG